MRVLVLDDERTISGLNQSQTLCDLFERRGHKALLFDGRDEGGRRVLNPKQAVCLIKDIVSPPRAREGRIDGVVLDIQWFGVRDYGIVLAEELISANIIGDDCRCVVFSHHVYDWVDTLTSVLKIPRDCLLTRNGTRIERVVDHFEEYANRSRCSTVTQQLAEGVLRTSGRPTRRAHLQGIRDDLRVADEMESAGVFVDYLGQYVAICNGVILGCGGDPVLVRNMAARQANVDAARIVVRYIGLLDYEY